MIHKKLFIEKYRPKSLTEVISNEEVDSLYKLIKEKPWDLPNLILSTRSAGTGKTSIAKAIINDLETDYLFLNASDDRGINTIRDKVKEFAMTQGFNCNAPKIVHLDEADGLTKDAQESLRGIIEQYSSNCRFIFTCNNDSKIIDPIKSRCIQINLNNPPKNKILNHIKNINKIEEINLTDKEIEEICDTLYPDIRSMLNALESRKYLGKIDIKSYDKEIYELIKKLKFTEARKLWIEQQISPRILIKSIYNRIILDDSIGKQRTIRAVEIIAESDYRITMGADAEITLANLAFQLINDVFK